MGRIEVVQNFTLIDQPWIDTRLSKYKHFSVKNFVDNICNEVFNYYQGMFNVLVYNERNISTMQFELSSNPIQRFEVRAHSTCYVVVVFNEGYCRIPLRHCDHWRAYGSYTMAHDQEYCQLDFVYSTTA